MTYTETLYAQQKFTLITGLRWASVRRLNNSIHRALCLILWFYASVSDILLPQQNLRLLGLCFHFRLLNLYAI